MFRYGHLSRRRELAAKIAQRLPSPIVRITDHVAGYWEGDISLIIMTVRPPLRSKVNCSIPVTNQFLKDEESKRLALLECEKMLHVAVVEHLTFNQNVSGPKGRLPV